MLENVAVSKCIRLRKSVRSFSDAKVEEEKIMKILEAAFWAPSAGGLHWISVILVRDKKKILEVLSKNAGYIISDIINAILENDTCNRYLRNVRVMIIVGTNVSKYRQAYDDPIKGAQSKWRELSMGDLFSVNDADLAALNMTLQAHALGIGVCWIGHINGDKIRELFKIDEEEAIMPICILLIGYPDEKGEEKIKVIIDRVKEDQKKRKPPKAHPEDIYSEETYGNPLSKLGDLKKEMEKVRRMREAG